jgi:hypothetical protein
VITGTFTNFPSLVEPLPPLVRKQRRLEATIVAVAQAVKDEKAVRAEIDLLLVAAGLKKSELVTCLGYDVIHNEKKGQSSLNSDTLTELLVAAGVDRALVDQTLIASTETGDPSKFCTVKPSKGAKVRA